MNTDEQRLAHAVAEGYDDFSSLYDRFWGHRSCHWLPVIDRVLLRDNGPPRHVLDVCCGTGRLGQALHELGYRVTGIDGSARMVSLARRNAPGCEFIVTDVRSFRTNQRFDLALSVFDSLNHLMCSQDLCLGFRSVRSSLKPQAPFLFDLNMEDGFRRRWRGTSAIVEPDVVCAVRSDFNEETATAEFHATWFRHQTEWQRHDVVLKQRCYTQEAIQAALTDEGFAEIRILDAVSDLGLENQVGRTFFLCRAVEHPP
jgi:SAM-dependent methyltransferase